MSIRLTFHGAAGTVTGSRHLFQEGTRAWLLDCGLFQGYKQLRLRNRLPLPIGPRRIGAVYIQARPKEQDGGRRLAEHLQG